MRHIVTTKSLENLKLGGFKKGHIPLNKGKRGLWKWSKESKEKLSRSKIGIPSPMKGKKRKPFSEEWKRNISLGSKGKIISKETRIKIGKSHSGNKSHFWKGGIQAPDSFYERRRNLRKKINGKSHTYQQWLNLKEFCKYTCLSCGKKEPEIKLTEDHIIPISKGGNDSIENIQPLCKKCNCIKYTKIINHSKIQNLWKDFLNTLV